MKFLVIFIVALTGFSGISIENVFAEEQILILIENDVRKLYYTGENIMSALFDPYTASVIFETGENANLYVKAPKIYKYSEQLVILRNGEEFDAAKDSDECFYYLTFQTQSPEKIELIFAHWPEATTLIENCETFTIPPLKQFKTISADKISCNHELVLILKYDGTPACVKPETKQKLIERGWAKTSIEHVDDSDKLMGYIQGVVLLGPTCPVIENPPDPECADKPYATRLVVTTADQARVIKEFSSDVDGKFIVKVQPGEYAIRSAAASNILPYCTSNDTIKVSANDYTKITVYCDTGIR